MDDQEKKLEKMAEQSYYDAREFGLNKGEALKASNNYHKSVEGSRKEFEENYRKEHGENPEREINDKY